MQFRKDITGLRAIAVIAVVLFHFNENWVPGGFAGVDVFFVISGFLMTGIIFRGIEKDNFSIVRFYIARANRIIPALAALCFILLIFGWFYLTPLDYRTLGKHVGSSIGFLSNIIYWKEEGYFDAASHEKWLLHTWSLSVEWQFYIIYPLVLVTLRQFVNLNFIKRFVLIGSIAGFVFCLIATYKWPNPAYYLLSSRAWEMMLGGVVYLYPLKLSERRKKIFEIVGVGLIFSSYIFISKENLWPGYLALLPVSGACLLIYAQRNNSVLTSNIAFQLLGKWSYSIYLWHWPFVVIIYYFSLSNIYIYIGIVLSVFFGFLSNRYIERKSFLNDFEKIIQYLKFQPMYMVIIVGFISSYVYLNGGLDNRGWVKDVGYTKEVKEQLTGPIWKYTNNRQCLDTYKFEGYESLQWWFCMKSKSGDPTLLLLGSSFANQLYPGFINNPKLRRHTVLSIGTCSIDSKPSGEIGSPCYGDIFEKQKTFINKIIKNNESLEYIIVDGLSENQNKETIDILLDRMKVINELRNDIKIIIFYPHVKIPFHPANCYRRNILGNKVDCKFSVKVKEDIKNNFFPLIEELNKHNYNISYFDQNVVFCNDNECSYVKNDLPLYRDSSPHTSEYSSILLQNHFNEWLMLNNIDML